MKLIDIFALVIETMALVYLMSNTMDCIIPPIFMLLILLGLQIFRRLIVYDAAMLSLVFSFAGDFAIIHLSYLGLVRKKLFLLAIFYSLLFIAETATTLILAYIFLVPFQMQMPFIIGSKVLLILFIMAFGNTLKTNENMNQWIIYLPIPVITIAAMIWSFAYIDNINRDVGGVVGLLCVFSILTSLFLICAIQRTSDKYILQNRLEVQKESNRLNIEYHQELKRTFETIEKTAHDLKHHLSYIEGCTDLDSIHAYIKKIKERTFVGNMRRYTGNKDIDILLNTLQPELNNISLHVSSNTLPFDIKWIDPVDIIIILGNGLTNAIEACNRYGFKDIFLSLNYDEKWSDWLIITIENPINHQFQRTYKIKNNGVGLISTKKGHHGFGMESMRASIERYNGHMEFDIENRVFKIDILLQNKT